MIDATHKLPVTRQAALLNLSRSNVYYLPRPVSDADLVLMRRIDELHLNFPFAGARMLRDMLKLEGVEVGRKHVRTLMVKVDINVTAKRRIDQLETLPDAELLELVAGQLVIVNCAAYLLDGRARHRAHTPIIYY